jgi:thioredoxin-like negative regulator of GroEL
MNVDLNEKFVERMGIHLHGYGVSLPYMIMFKNGQEVDRILQGASKQNIIARLKALI